MYGVKLNGVIGVEWMGGVECSGGSRGEWSGWNGVNCSGWSGVDGVNRVEMSRVNGMEIKWNG